MLDFQGKRVLVVGGATGMGAAVAQEAAALGAEVTVLDIAEVAFPAHDFIKIDLRDKTSVDSVVERLQGPIHALFSCAGVADGARGLMLINFISQRRIIEGLVAKGALPRGAAIGVISSAIGSGWQRSLPTLKEFLAIPDWEGQAAWVEAHKTDNLMTTADGYVSSKQVMCAYVALKAAELLRQGVRINAILPGSTDTPLARANPDTWMLFGADYRAAIGLSHLQPREMAGPLLFLCSPLASGVTGENLLVDQGYMASRITGSLGG